MGVLKKEVIKGKTRVQGGYKIGREATSSKSRKCCIILSPDVISFIEDFAYRMKKEKGLNVSTSGLTRSALRAFEQLPVVEQLQYLEDE